MSISEKARKREILAALERGESVDPAPLHCRYPNWPDEVLVNPHQFASALANAEAQDNGQSMHDE